MPIGILGLVGLGSAAISAALLWNRNTEGFGVIVADNFGLFVTIVLAIVGVLDDHVLVAGAGAGRDSVRRVLRAHAVLDRRHDHDGDGDRSARHLHRSRNTVARGLRADGHTSRSHAGDRGRLQVLPARRVLQRVLPLRNCVHVWRDRQHQAGGGRVVPLGPVDDRTTR